MAILISFGIRDCDPPTNDPSKTEACSGGGGGGRGQNCARMGGFVVVEEGGAVWDAPVCVPKKARRWSFDKFHGFQLQRFWCRGPQGWLPGCLIPCAHWWLHRTLGTGRQRLCAAGAPGLALWVPHPLRALTISRTSSGALLAHWEFDLLADPLWGH